MKTFIFGYEYGGCMGYGVEIVSIRASDEEHAKNVMGSHYDRYTLLDVIDESKVIQSLGNFGE